MRSEQAIDPTHQPGLQKALQHCLHHISMYFNVGSALKVINPGGRFGMQPRMTGLIYINAVRSQATQVLHMWLVAAGPPLHSTAGVGSNEQMS